MQASQQHRILGMSNRLYHQPKQNLEAYWLPGLQTLNPQLCYSDNSINGTNFSTPSSYEKYCILESSSATGSYIVYNSPSTVSFTSGRSPMSLQDSHSCQADPHHSAENANGSPMSGSCITGDVKDLRHKLRELENELLGPDFDVLSSYDSTYQCEAKITSTQMDSCRQMVEIIPRWDLRQVLTTCAKAVSEKDMLTAEWLMAELRQMVSDSGEPYLLEGLVARLLSSGTAIYKALRCKEPASSELLSYMHILYEVCPCFKFGCMSANGAIAEAMKDENRVHIIDFQIAQGSQWITLIQAFAARPGGPPHIRITGIDDSASAYARGGGLNIVGRRLSMLAESFKVPFEFHAAAMSGCEVRLEDLRVRPGEALAVNFAFMLHHMPVESVSPYQNHEGRLLRLVKSLSPKVVTLVEQESNTSTAAFFPRFPEAPNYYNAMFESIDVEQHCLARDVGCEGLERVERHELLDKWRLQFAMAGFTRYPLSSLVNATIKRLLENYSDKYRIEERDGALYLGWTNRDLVASCAWK